MKPKNLKFPFSWEERQPMISDGVLFVPEYYQKHQEWSFPGWEDACVFGRRAPIHIEYCTGNGAWIIEKALQNPGCNWVAVEWRFERVRKIWSKMRNHQLSNLFIVCGEAQAFTQHYVPEGSFDAVYVNFPDPWPKEKHAKNRLFQRPFIDDLARVCAPNARLTVATDHVEYTQQICNEMCAHPHWDSVFPDPFYVTHWDNYGSSYFDQLWREKGLAIHYMQFSRGEK